MEIKKESSFSRSLANLEKMGAYYTDVGMCKRIGRMFKRSNGRLFVLEPSIGDGSAVRAVMSEITGEGENMRLFGVELDEKTAYKVKAESKEGDMILHTDFLRGLMCSSNVFGFCFANPPYGEEPFLKVRYEQLFVKSIAIYIKKGGLLALVIPFYVMRTPDFIGAFMQRFELLGMYRFDDSVYKQFQQIVMVGKRRERMSYVFGPKEREAFFATCETPETLPYLPLEVKEEDKYLIPECTVPVAQFTTVQFDRVAAAKSIRNDRLYETLGECISGERYVSSQNLTPPIIPKKDILYLCATAGAGQGLCGSEEKRNLHLQRGVVKKGEMTTYGEPDEEDEEKVSRKKGRYMEVVTFADVSITIIENDGKITTLSGSNSEETE